MKLLHSSSEKHSKTGGIHMLKRIFALVLAILSLSFVATAALVPAPDMVEPCACSHPSAFRNYRGSTYVDFLNYTNCLGSKVYYDIYGCTNCGVIIEVETGHTTINHDIVGVFCTRCGFNSANGTWPNQ